MKLDKHVVDMFTELTKPADDVKMEKTCYGTISVVDGTRYVKLDGSDLLVPAASTVKTSHGDRVTVLMKNHSLTVTGNLTAPATDGEGGSSGEAGTAATIEVGTVITGEAGSSASVTNSGTTSAAVFDFVIPRGDKGEKGDVGPQGPQGEKGDTGTWDGTIPEHDHTVSDITDFPASLPANGGNADTLDGKHADDFWKIYNHIDDSYDADNAREPGLYRIRGGINTPAANWYDIHVTNLGGFITQIAISDVNSMFKRNFTGVWSEWIEFAYKVDIPTSLPANGGNADTVDGLHAGDFFNNIADHITPESSGKDTLLEYIRSINSFTSNFYTSRFDDLPTNNWGYNVTVYKAGGAVYVIAYRALSNHEIYVRDLNFSGEWNGDWTRLNDGGNADTVGGLHANEIASNPNLLINPDFRINQRGISSPTVAFGVDRWIGTYTVSNNTIVFSQTEQFMIQLIENIDSLIGREATATVYYDDGTADKGTAAISDATYFFATSRTHCLVYVDNGIKGLEIWAAAPCNIVGVKLELGSIATPFVPPDPATELAKCQRYYYSTYQGVPAGTPASYANELILNAISANRFNHTTIDFPTTMRTTPTVKFFDPDTGEEGYACMSGSAEKVPVNVLIAGQNRAAIGSSGLTVGADYYLHYTASAELSS